MKDYKGIQVGSLIKATIFKGYLRVTAIEQRIYTQEDQDRYNSHGTGSIFAGIEYNPLIRFDYVFEENGKPSKRKSGAVDGGFAILAKDYIAREIIKLQELGKRLKEISNEL